MKKVILLFTVIFIVSCQTDKINLGLKLKEGEQYQYRIESLVFVSQEINGRVRENSISVNSSMTFLVNEVTDNGYNMSVHYDSLGMTMEMIQGIMHYNSNKNNESDIFSLVLSVIAEKPFTIKLDKHGYVLDINNLEEILQSATDRIKNLPDAKKSQLKEQFLKTFGPEVIKGNMELLTTIYPKQPLGAEEKWIVETKMEAGMRADVSTEYKIVDISNEVVKINGKSEVTTENKNAYFNNNGLDFKYDLTGTIDSEIEADRETGWVKNAEIQQEIKGTATIRASQQMPAGLEIPIVTMTKIAVTGK